MELTMLNLARASHGVWRSDARQHEAPKNETRKNEVRKGAASKNDDAPGPAAHPGAPKLVKEKLAKEAAAPFVFNLGGDDRNTAGFFSSATLGALRDLNPLAHQRMQNTAFFLKSTTPFGKRIVEVITSYVVGEGFRPAASDPRVQALVNALWNDPINNFEENLEAWCDELTTFGELCLPVQINPVSGFVRYGYVDPQRIERVEYGLLKTHSGPHDFTIPTTVHLRPIAPGAGPETLKVIRLDEDDYSPTYGQLTGDCFYFAINKAKGASRGLSDLFSLADWIDLFDKMIFDFASKVRHLNSFVWHYTLHGADEKRTAEVLKQVTARPPRSGEVQVTNEQVSIEARTPDLRGADMAESVRLVKLYGLGGAGLPAWFFADPTDSNRATADEMTGPTGKKLTARQNVLKRAVLAMLRFAVSQAIAHGVLPANVDTTLTLQVPDLMIKDLQKAGATLGAVVNAVSIMEANGWIRSETAARTSHVVLSQIGVEVDSKNEFTQARAELDQRRRAQTNTFAPEQNLPKDLETLDQNGRMV